MKNSKELTIDNLFQVVKDINKYGNILGKEFSEIKSTNYLMRQVSLINDCIDKNNSQVTPDAHVQYFGDFNKRNQSFDDTINSVVDLRKKTVESIQDFSSSIDNYKEELSSNKKLLDFMKNSDDVRNKEDLVKYVSLQTDELESKLEEVTQKCATAKLLEIALYEFNAIIFDNSDSFFRTVTDLNVREVINLPESYSLGNIQDLPKVKVVVADTFDQGALPSTELIIDSLNQHLDPECKHEGYVPRLLDNGNIQTHGIEVSSIITSLAPNVSLIPKEYFLHDHVENMKNLYDAKVINFSSRLFDFDEDGALEQDIIDLAKDRIVVKSLGNHSNSLLYREAFFEKILENEHVKNHVIFVGNILPDAKTIHPTSGIPGANKLVQDMTVCAPGWVPAQTLNTQTADEYDLAAKKAYEENGEIWPPYNLSVITSDDSCTSYAAPVVTALVTQLITLFPMLSLADIVNLVKLGATKIGNADVYGHGAVNFLKSVDQGIDLFNNSYGKLPLSNLSGFVITDQEDLDGYKSFQKKVINNYNKDAEDERNKLEEMHKIRVNDLQNKYAMESHIQHNVHNLEISSLRFEVEVAKERAYSDLNEVQDLSGLVHDHGDWFIQ